MASAVIPAFLGPLTRISLTSPLTTIFAFFSNQSGRSLQRPFRLEKQRQTEWCWAAVGASVRKHRGGSTLSQCQVAERVWPGYNCCSDPEGCNSPATLEETLVAINHLREPIYDTVDPERIDDEIRSNRPVCCGLIKGGAGHFVVITGWYRSGSEVYLNIQDPTYGSGEIAVAFRKLLQGYRDAVWADTYLVS